MISIIRYVSAERRLKEAQKTVIMLGGEDETPPMVLAQRDMIELERNYYRDEATDFLVHILVASILCIPIFLYWKNYV